MGPKKKSKVIFIIIIILVILILLTGLVYAYFATDLFKSNKERFFQYITQMGDEKEGFMDRQLKEYLEKKKNMPFANEGNLVLKVTTEEGDSKEYDTINNFNISFSGQTDKTNNSLEQNISLNYSDEIAFPVSYRKIENTIGLQTKYVSSKYIAVNTQELENQNDEYLATASGLIGQSEELGKLAQLPFKEEDWKRLQENYINVVNTQLQETQFTQIEKGSQKGYKLTLNGEEVKSVIIQLLEMLKKDQATIDKINEYIEDNENKSKLTTSQIDNAIKNLDKNSLDRNYEITVYQQKGKTTKLVLATEEATIQLEKKNEENSLQYSISYRKNENNEGISFRANYTGLSTMQNIQENYELEIQPSKEVASNDNLVYQYQYQNQIDFGKANPVEEFSDENAMILNDYEEEQVSNFLGQVKERIEKVNQQQMEELGLQENENPLVQMIMPLRQSLTYSQAAGAINNSSNISEIEVNTFNQKFENYESTNLQGVTVKGLLSTIQLNNESQENEDRKVKEIHFDGEEYEATDSNIVILKSSVETETAYRVEFERNETTGLIYRVVINKK